ncbi:hypothetical protein N566_18650 [Streptomycetaceae bacterium MP113-05]|nr:hypothetical protein N566_18650 [Streptomycetaceae bacterium MP113-05]
MAVGPERFDCSGPTAMWCAGPGEVEALRTRGGAPREGRAPGQYAPGPALVI